MPKEPVTKTTPSLTEEQLNGLRDLLPQAFSEGRIDFDKLKAALGDVVDEQPERYSFSWAGKRDAIRLLQAPSRATLIPIREESLDFDTTQNLFIQGDNLEVLKLLYKPYFGRVKMIYIDPPYNTGNDFIYPDNFVDPLDTYLKLTGQKDAEGNMLNSNPETSGRYHSAWLSMMYPRLVLARQLLRDDGVIFISIDDHEIHNLRLLMNEVFGEENSYVTLAWQRKDTPSNDTNDISVTHEYIVCFTKSDSFRRNLLPRTEDQLRNYKNPDNDPRGVWIRTALTRKEYVEHDYYPIKNPQGRDRYPPKGTSWRVSKKTLEWLKTDNRLWWGESNDGDMPFAKRFLSEVQAGVVPTTWWDYEFAGSNRNSKMEMRSLFENPPFDTPKPSKLIYRLLQISTDRDFGDVVLDFFAGSGTTGQAVLDLNRQDNGNRRFILVQLPEPIKNGQFQTIADICKERIRRVVAKMKKEREGQLVLEKPEDLGFRVFQLAPSNYKQWPDPQPDAAAYTQQAELFTDALVEGWNPENVLYEVALKEGYGLNLKVEKCAVEGAQVVSDTDKGQSFFISLSPKINLDELRPLNLRKDDLFVCRDSALDDDTAANLALQCRLKTI